MHVLSGVLFMASWPLFRYCLSLRQSPHIVHSYRFGHDIALKTCYACSNSTEARYFAAVVPFLNSLRLLIYGLRLYTDEALVKSVSREGKPE